MKQLTIRISDYPSKYFPVKVEWKTGDYHSWNAWQSNVFETEQQAADYIFGRFGNIPYRLIDTRQKPKRQQVFKKGVDIPKSVRNKTYYNMRKYNLCSYDAFEAALRGINHNEIPVQLFIDWYNSDLAKYLA